jgi:hypothetical protein
VSDAYVLGADVTAGGVPADLEVGEGVYEFLSSPVAGALLVKDGVNDTSGDGVADTGEPLAPEMSAPEGYTNVNPFTTMLVNGATDLATMYPAAAAVMANFDFDVVEAGAVNLDVAKETAKAALTLSAEQHGGTASSASSDASESSDSSVCLPGQNCDGSSSSESSDASESSESSESSVSSESSESSVSSGGSIVPDPFAAATFRAIVPDPFEEPDTSSSSSEVSSATSSTIVPDPFASSSSDASVSSDSSDSSASSESSVSSDSSSSAGGYDLTEVFAAIDECTDVECINGHVKTKMVEINGAYTAPASSSEASSDEASSSDSSVCLPGQNCDDESSSSSESVCLPGQNCDDESSSSEETASSSSEAEEPTCPEGYIYSGDPATGCIVDPDASSSSEDTASSSSDDSGTVVPNPFA